MDDRHIALEGTVWMTVGGEQLGGTNRVGLLAALAQHPHEDANQGETERDANCAADDKADVSTRTARRRRAGACSICSGSRCYDISNVDRLAT